MLGMSSPEWSRYMRDELGLAMDPAEISREVVRLMMRHYRDRLPLMNGADGAVRSLAGEWPLAMASAANREIIDLVIELAGWAGLFAVTVSAEEVAHGKPEPDVYLDAVGRLGSTPGDCVAIEDSSAGIRSAAAAGLSVVAIPNRAFPPEASVLAQADLLLGSIEELDSGAIRRAASA